MAWIEYRPVDETNEKSEMENREFRKMLRKHLPGVLRELSNVGAIQVKANALHDYLRQCK